MFWGDRIQEGTGKITKRRREVSLGETGVATCRQVSHKGHKAHSGPTRGNDKLPVKLWLSQMESGHHLQRHCWVSARGHEESLLQFSLYYIKKTAAPMSTLSVVEDSIRTEPHSRAALSSTCTVVFTAAGVRDLFKELYFSMLTC